MRASRFAWLLAILLALWCAEAHADACAGLSAPLSMLAWDQKSIIFVDGFSWSVSPTYLDANGQLQTYFAAAMGLQLQGIQEIANDQGDFCVADGNIDTTAFPWTNSAYYQIMNVSLLDCKYIQSTQYIRSANVTLNTTTIVAKSSSLPGFQITANLSTSDKEWSFVTHTDPSTNETLVSTYKPSQFKITVDIFSFPFMGTAETYPNASSSYLTLGLYPSLKMPSAWNLTKTETDNFHTVELTAATVDHSVLFQYSHENAFFVDGEFIMRTLGDNILNLTDVNVKYLGLPTMMAICNGTTPAYQYGHFHYDPTIVAIFSGPIESPSSPSGRSKAWVAAIVVTLVVIVVVAVASVLYWNWRQKTLEMKVPVAGMVKDR